MQAPLPVQTQGQISITFLDRDGLRQEQSHRGPVAVSVTDLTRAFDALQFGTWTTAALQLGRTSHNDLTDAERRQYELAVVGYSEGSFKTNLALLAAVMLFQSGHMIHDPLATQLELAAILKIWDTLERTIDAMGASYQQPDLAADDRLLGALTRYVRKVARSARDSGREVLLHAKNPYGREVGFQTNHQGNLRLLGSPPMRGERGEPGNDEPDRRIPYPYSDGSVVNTEPNYVIIEGVSPGNSRATYRLSR